MTSLTEDLLSKNELVKNKDRELMELKESN